MTTRLLRRATLAPTAEAIDVMTDRSQDDIVDHLLTDADAEIDATDRWSSDMPTDDDWQVLLQWWVGEMLSPQAGLVDRMTWFWHTHLTTAFNKVDSAFLVRQQLRLLRSHSLGSFRDLLHGFVRDGALIRYLDAEWSVASNPNENLARELMELFTIGRGHYSQDDVRAAARALAGWRVRRDEGVDPEVYFDRSASFIAPLVFMGEMDDWDTQKIVDRLLDHPATAVRVGSLVHAELTGVALDESAAADLGSWWQDQDLEIRPLVERILRSEHAVGDTLRPRSGLEWFIAAQAATGQRIENTWEMRNLGQMPYDPPNVAGWKRGAHWLTAGALLPRGSAVHGGEWNASVLERATSTDDVLRQCAIAELSASSSAAFNQIETFTDLPPDALARNRWRLALNAPEFHLQ